VYYQPRPVSATELVLIRPINEPHLDYPFASVRLAPASDIPMARQVGIDRVGGRPRARITSGRQILHIVRPTNEARLSGAELLEHVWNAWLDGVAVAVTSMPSLCYEKE
jgi:hypothetical protein